MTTSSNNMNRAPRGGDPGKTGDLSAARQAAAVRAAETKRAAKRAAESAQAESTPAAKPTRRSARGSEVAAREKRERREARRQGAETAPKARPRTAKAAKDGSSRRGQGAQQDVMKYAADNRAVRWFYDLTTGPRRYAFYLLVGLLIGVGLYWPVRDYYVALRTEDILEQQKAIREAYNEDLGREVEGLLSQEGIEDAARRDYGMVMPGEKTITVEGLDEHGEPVVVDQGAEDQDAPADGADGAPHSDSTGAHDPASKSNCGKLKGEDAADKSKTGSGSGQEGTGGKPTTSAEVEAAERAVLENSAWYWKLLDTIFGFDGVNGMAVVSTGE